METLGVPLPCASVRPGVTPPASLGPGHFTPTADEVLISAVLLSSSVSVSGSEMAYGVQEVSLLLQTIQ